MEEKAYCTSGYRSIDESMSYLLLRLRNNCFILDDDFGYNLRSAGMISHWQEVVHMLLGDQSRFVMRYTALSPFTTS